MSAYFYSRHCTTTNASQPFFFVTGDEGYWETMTPQMLKNVMDITEIVGESLWKELMKKFNVFHIKKAFWKSQDEIQIKKQWVKTLGEERVLSFTNPKACIDVMLGAICLTSGTRTLDQYIKDMKVREQTKARITEVTAALQKYWDLLKSKKIKPVEAKNEKVTTTSSSSTTSKDFTELREVTEKLLTMQIDTDEDKDYYKGLKDLSKTLGAWLTSKDSSPVTDSKLDNKDLIPNIVLQKLVKEFYEKNK